MSDTSSGITNQMFRVWLRHDGIIQEVLEPWAVIDLDDAIASLDAIRTLVGGGRYPLLVDVRAVGPLSRMSGNLLLAASRPKPPTWMFDDDATAFAWLSEFAA